MKASTKKPALEITEKDKLELQSVKVYKKVHREVKKIVAVTEENISDFISEAIIEKLRK